MMSITDVADRFNSIGIAATADAALCAYTTFRLGGPCPILVRCESPDQVLAAIEIINAAGTPYELIGGGSNLLISDHGLDCAVVRYVTDDPAIDHEGEELTVTGGTALDAVADYAVTNGLGGFVNTSGIPGTVGGAIIGNAGAFGWQVGDALKTVDLVDRNGNRRIVNAGEIGFRYRDSDLKKTREIVLSAVFQLNATDPTADRLERERILALRASKHPDLRVDSCAGSFFRNVEPTSAADRRQAAGYFLEQIGAKDMRVRGAAVYEKHANIIIKGGEDCLAQDVLDLSRKMVAAVQEKFDLTLVREASLLGKFKPEA